MSPSSSFTADNAGLDNSELLLGAPNGSEQLPATLLFFLEERSSSSLQDSMTSGKQPSEAESQGILEQCSSRSGRLTSLHAPYAATDDGSDEPSPRDGYGFRLKEGPTAMCPQTAHHPLRRWLDQSPFDEPFAILGVGRWENHVLSGHTFDQFPPLDLGSIEEDTGGDIHMDNDWHWGTQQEHEDDWAHWVSCTLAPRL